MNFMLMNLGLAPIYNPFVSSDEPPPPPQASFNITIERAKQRAQKALEIIAANPGCTTELVSARLGLSRSGANTICRKLREDGLLTSKQLNSAVPARWYVR